MSGTIYLYLLILCGIWSPRLIGTFADDEIKKSSDFIIRQKRVISYDEQGGTRIVRIEEKPYIARIKRLGRFQCMGTILSHLVVITAAACAEFHATEYQVSSKSSITHQIGTPHNVTDKIERKGNIPRRPMDGIALLTIDPPIVYGTFVKKIELHVRPLLPGMIGSVTGWGYNCRNRVTGPGTNYTTHLRSIEVPIISHQDCVNSYRNYYPITDKDICTYHSQRHCGHTDRGAPLIINNLLVGIFLRSGSIDAGMNREFPEVFAFLQHTYYSDWIRANI